MNNRPNKLLIIVAYDLEDPVQVELRQDAKVKHLKKRLSKRFNIKLNDQRLTLMKKILQDNEKLCQYAENHISGIPISLQKRVEGITVKVKFEDQWICFENMKPVTNISHLKRLLNSKLETKIEIEKQILRFKHKTLFNEYALEFYSRNDIELSMELEKRKEGCIEVFAKNEITNRTISMLIEEGVRVKDLKKTFVKTEQLNVANIIFKKNGKTLKDREKLDKLRIDNQDMIYYNLREQSDEYESDSEDIEHKPALIKHYI